MRLRSLLAVLFTAVLVAACSDEPEPDREDSAAPDSSESATEELASVDPVQFRIVEFSDEGPAPAGDRKEWRQFDKLNCSADPVPSVPTPAERPVVACSPPREGLVEGESTPAIKYALGPAEIVGGVVDADASIPEGQTEWVVSFELDADASAAFSRIGQELVDTGKQFAIVLDGVVVSAPTVNDVITNGLVQIAGGLTADEAEALADQLVAGST